MGNQSPMRALPSYLNYGCGPFDRRLVLSYVFALIVFGIALTVRFMLGESLPPGFPYLSFFPAVIIVAFVGGLWPGILVALLSGIASWYYFIPPFHSFALDGGSLLALGFFVFIVTVDIFVINLAVGAFVEADQLTRKNKQLSDFQSLLIQELDHRIKNLFSVVASVVKLSARYAETPQQLAEEVNDRIMALGRSHGALWRVGKEHDATVQSVARLVLAPYLTEHSEKISIGGNSEVLDIRVVQILSLIFHELATNAAKYGALAQPSGRVEIFSRLDASGAGQVTVEWREHGIVASEPTDQHRGFGSELIERLVNSAGGKLEKIFDHAGMTTSVTFAAP